MAISMLKIRRPLGRLIFNMGIAIPGKTVFLIEMAPRAPSQYKDHLQTPFSNAIILNENNYILIQIPQKFVPIGSIN